MPTSKSAANSKTSHAIKRSQPDSPSFSLTTTKPRDIVADVLLVNTAPAKGKGVELVAHGFTPAQTKRIQLDIAALGGTGKSGEVITLTGVVGVKSQSLLRWDSVIFEGNSTLKNSAGHWVMEYARSVARSKLRFQVASLNTFTQP